LPRIVAETTVGKKVDVIVWRQGNKTHLKIELGELNEGDLEEEKEEPTEKLNGNYKTQDLIGLKVIEIDDRVRKDYSLEDDASGLLVMSVVDGVEEIRAGDVLVSVNQQSIKDVNHLKSVISKARRKKRKSVLLLINRDGETIFVAAAIDNK
jgi:serine protease Do